MTRTLSPQFLARLLVCGSGITSLANSFTIPFMAIFLRHELGLEPVTVGFIVGSSVFFSITAGLVGGALSDILGRKRVLLFSLAGVVVSMLGFYFSEHVVAVFACNSMLALCSSSFNPTGKALLSDLLPSDQRVKWFSYQYVAYNAGFAIGPLIGVWAGFSGGRVSFVLAAIAFGIYLVALTIALGRELPGVRPATTGHAKVLPGLRDTARAILADRRLQCFLIAALLLEAVHSRISTLLAQYLYIEFDDAVRILAVVMTTNAATVVVFQLFASQFVLKRNPVHAIVIGSALMVCGMVGFAFSGSMWAFVVAMVVFTIGETFIVPSEFAIIDRIAPEDLRGSYFGAQTFAQFGGFIGPYLGGVLLAGYGGQVMFLAIGSLALVSIGVYVTVGRRMPALMRTTATAEREKAGTGA
jgi:MFS family permease